MNASSSNNKTVVPETAPKESPLPLKTANPTVVDDAAKTAGDAKPAAASTPKQPPSPEDNDTISTASNASRISEDQRSKARARRGSRVTERRVSSESIRSAYSNVESKTSAAPKRATSNGSVSVLSIDEGSPLEEGDVSEGNDADDVAEVPAILYSQDSKAATTATTAASSSSVYSKDGNKSTAQGEDDEDIVDEILSAQPTELSRANNRNMPPAQPGAVRIVGMGQDFSESHNDDADNIGNIDIENFQAVDIENQDNHLGAAKKELHMDADGNLIDAELVDADTDRRRLQETLKDVLHSQDAVQVVDVEAEDKLKRERQRRNLWVYGGIAVVLTIIIIVAVVVSVQKVQESNTEAPSAAPSSSPTAAPTSRISAVQMYVEEVFGGPIPSVEEYPFLPQARAIQWLTEEDTTTTFPFESEEAEYAFYDRYVATVMGYAWKYLNWNDNTNWLDGDLSHCEWQGLSCNDDGRISVLDLAVQNLQGNIPSEIGFLDNLDFVFLFRNSLTGNIPSEIGNLGDADFMYLNENQLTGSIPNEMGGLLDADDLFLFGNQLTGTIPETFGDLVDLVNLYIYDNQLSGSIPSSFHKLKLLQRLYLNNNRLEGGIPPQLGGIIGLQRLKVENNLLTGLIPSELGDFLALELLSLQGNGLAGPMPDAVCNLRDNGAIDNLEVLEADCLAQVQCDCCTACF
ncbi:MAG: hypothetical protein SGILL_002412 [Bacillariaceae sp.]